jgi:epsin
MEKEARQWREIYKALQLLEYLIKHGSERVVDDARSHVSTIKMLRNFHYIDDKGKDEGLNGKAHITCTVAFKIDDNRNVVRNRARELVEILSDVEKIRTERRKAKANRHKYTGTGNDGMSLGSGGRYGGFEGGSYGNSGGGSYSGGGSSSYDQGQNCLAY